ncbi:MAG TPA: ABC transporter permease [Ktedonosporobacter sp.]|nr:ABC transporter permease [Ktedonosporobacter sp.]
MADITKSLDTPASRPVQDLSSIHHGHRPPRQGVPAGILLESAIQALRTNRMRSFLTMLGMIIGVSAVIAITTLTQGVNENVTARFASLGTNVLTITSAASSSAGGVRSAGGSSQSLTLGDVQALQTQVPSVANLSPVLTTTQQVVSGDQNWNTQIRGIYPTDATIQNVQVAQGSWLNDQQEQSHLSVAVLGQTVANNLFPDPTVNPVGQTIRIGSQPFQVIGVLQSIGAQGSSNADDIIYAPFSTVQVRFRNTTSVDQIQVQVDTLKNLVPAQIAIMTLLRSRHHLQGSDPAITVLLQQQNHAASLSLSGSGGPGTRGGGFGGAGAGGPSPSGSAKGTQTTAQPDDFTVLNNNQLVQSAQQNANVLTVLLVGVAAISLTIGGIGIMNIMLVTVSERVREIGVCLAIGARQRDVRHQFLLEALTLSIVGGLIGLFIGLLGGFGLTTWLGFSFLLNTTPILLAFGVSAAVGVTFGFYPALRASRLDPITALRME